jgi:hypothetical protein
MAGFVVLAGRFVVTVQGAVGSGWSGLPWVGLVAAILFGAGVFLGGGGFGITLGAACSAYAPGRAARFGLGGLSPSGTLSLGGPCRLDELLAGVDVVDALAVTGLEVRGGGGSGGEVVGYVHIV